MIDLANFTRNADYYATHGDIIEAVLDEMVAAIAPQPGDTPAHSFAATVTALDDDPDRVVTLAAAALMRLAGQTRTGTAPHDSETSHG